MKLLSVWVSTTCASISKTAASLANGAQIDEWLIHLPVSNKRGTTLELDESATIARTWAQMEDCLKSGKVRTIGVSNFSVKTLTELLETAKIVPAINSVRIHAFSYTIETKMACTGRSAPLPS